MGKLNVCCNNNICHIMSQITMHNLKVVHSIQPLYDQLWTLSFSGVVSFSIDLVFWLKQKERQDLDWHTMIQSSRTSRKKIFA